MAHTFGDFVDINAIAFKSNLKGINSLRVNEKTTYLTDRAIRHLVKRLKATGWM